MKTHHAPLIQSKFQIIILVLCLQLSMLKWVLWFFNKWIYDVGDFSLLCSESSPRSERWRGGEFIGIDRVLVWSNEGRGYLYRLPIRYAFLFDVYISPVGMPLEFLGTNWIHSQSWLMSHSRDCSSYVTFWYICSDFEFRWFCWFWSNFYECCYLFCLFIRLFRVRLMMSCNFVYLSFYLLALTPTRRIIDILQIPVVQDKWIHIYTLYWTFLLGLMKRYL